MGLDGRMKNHVNTRTNLGEGAEETTVEIFRSIMRARHLLHQQAASVAARYGLHAAELNVVDILGKFGPISMGRLSRETFISPSNTTSTVKKLEAAGLVARKRSENSDREVTVMLTASGRSLFRKCYPRILGDVYAHLRERLSERDMQRLADILSKVTA